MTQATPRSARHTLLLGAGLFALGALTLAAQVPQIASPDTAFLLYAAERVLDGAHLYRDVVEINPPLIVWFNAGVVLLARALHMSDLLGYRVVTLGVLIGLYGVCHRLVRRYLLPEDERFGTFLLLLLFFALFPFSGADFGQREHFVLALLAPYLLLIVTRASPSPREPGVAVAVAIGLAAGTALALKPHFAIAWLALEGWGRMRVAANRWRVTPEVVATTGLLVGYVAAIALLTPAYFDVVRRLGPMYLRYLQESVWTLLLLAPGAALVFLALLAHVVLRSYERDRNLGDALAAGVVGCYLSGVAQQKGLPYHFYPASALALVLLSLVALDAPRAASRLSQRIYGQAARASAATLVLLTLASSVIEALGGSQREREARAALLAHAQFLRAHSAGRPVGVLSYHLDGAFPLVSYAGVRLASRFPHLWLLPASYWDALQSDGPLDYREPAAMAAPERFLWDAVREDLLSARPAVLLVLSPARDLPRNGLRRLQYIRYFGRDPGLGELFKGYEFVGMQGEYEVYEAVPPGAPRSGPPPAPDPGRQDVRIGSLSGTQLRIEDPQFLAGMALLALTWAFIALRGRKSGSAPPRG
jgi:hypothetical protein